MRCVRCTRLLEWWADNRDTYMLQVLSIKQFGGKNTSVDSENIGTAMARVATNFMLRPIGGLGMPPAWTYFQPGGTTLDLGFVNNIDYLFDGGRLLLQDSNSVWWDVTPRADGPPNNVTVSYSSSTISANLLLTSGQILAFKINANLHWKLLGDADVANYGIEKLGAVPFYTTRYTTDRAFLSGYGPVIPDGKGNSWKMQADPVSGLYAITI